ncbi:hypothetical protein CVT24_001451 [Panaeolus cyanescens]|uniref:Ubiquitin-like domain-containing protein n=1 Tax=Panaeolus cyanescens TaxID=181874 RepID=A0A409WY37_9AGAR|nr:hypothetical protein CVT24_001451 [Panaeolus cyanescens]
MLLDGESQFNDNSGIKASLTFTPLPAENLSKKCRSNAKPKAIIQITYFHKDFTLQDVLVKAFDILDCRDLLEASWLYHGRSLDTPDSFSTTYTIPRKVTLPVILNNVTAFKQMVKEATTKANAEVKLFFVENKVPVAAERADDESEGEDEPPTKKQKGLTTEEIEQSHIITDLEFRAPPSM